MVEPEACQSCYLEPDTACFREINLSIAVQKKEDRELWYSKSATKKSEACNKRILSEDRLKQTFMNSRCTSSHIELLGLPFLSAEGRYNMIHYATTMVALTEQSRLLVYGTFLSSIPSGVQAKITKSFNIVLGSGNTVNLPSQGCI
jgi:hypothetical protein